MLTRHNAFLVILNLVLLWLLLAYVASVVSNNVGSVRLNRAVIAVGRVVSRSNLWIANPSNGPGRGGRGFTCALAEKG